MSQQRPTNKIITLKTARSKGLKYYNTGTPCKNGHLSNRRVCNTHCLQCAAERQHKIEIGRRLMILNALGPGCMCCGELEIDFLTLGHVKKDGASHRLELGGQWRVFRYLYKEIRDGRVKSARKKFRVLCANCHLAITKNGVCTHHG